MKVVAFISCVLPMIAVAEGLSKARQDYCEGRAEAAVATAEARDQGAPRYRILNQAADHNKMHHLREMVNFVYGEGKHLPHDAIRSKFLKECIEEMSK